MRRLFSKFPGGTAGLGLLLLRIALSAGVLAHGVYFLTTQENATVFSAFGSWIAIFVGAMLLVGFLTPLMALLVLVSCIYLALQPVADITNFARLAFVISISASVILLGPGAFSLDARLFSRREIVFPDDLRAPQE